MGMRKVVLLLALMVTAMFGSASVAYAVEMLDQENALPLESPYNYVEFNSDYQYAAKFSQRGRQAG